MVGRPASPGWRTAEAATVVTPQLEALDSGGIPLWVVVLAAVIGALLLLLLIFLLYKVSHRTAGRTNLCILFSKGLQPYYFLD